MKEQAAVIQSKEDPTSEDFKRYMRAMNPLYHYLSYFRSIIMDGVVPSLAVNLECLLIGIASLVIGMIVFAKLQDNFILHV